MAQVNIGAIKFNWKGPYNNGTAYVVDDVVSSGGSSYVCILASTGNAVSNGTYWQIMSSAGTNGSNGTDLTSTLSARGDIVFKGASALTRLPKGTAGYYLKQGANDPEWSAVSGGDYVKLASGNCSGSSVSIDGYYSATYDFYKLIVMNVRNDASNRQFRWQMNQGGNALTGSNYRWTYRGNYMVSNGTSSAAHGGSYTTGYMNNGWDLSTGTDRGSMLEMNIYDPLSTTNQKFMAFTTEIDAVDGSYFVSLKGGGYYNGLNSSAFSGITIFPQAGSFAGGKWKLYGIKA